MVSLTSGGYFAWRSSCCRAFQNFNVFGKIWMIWAFRYVYHFLSLDPLFLSKETGQINVWTKTSTDTKIQRYKDVFPSSTWAEASSQLVFMVLFSTLPWTFMNPWNVFTCCTPRLGGSKVISSNVSDSLKHGGTDSGTVWLTDAIHKLVVPHLGLEFFGVHCVSNGGTLDLRNLPSPRAYLDLFGFGPLSRLQTNLSYVLVVGLRDEVGPSTRVLNDSMILCYIVFPEVSETFLHFLQTGLILATCLQTSIHHHHGRWKKQRRSLLLLSGHRQRRDTITGGWAASLWLGSLAWESKLPLTRE